jgi:acyl-CoA hydrolase
MKKLNIPTKTCKESQVIMTELVLPTHTNQLGTIFGGQIMAWIDIAAAVAATKHAKKICVTASIDALHFVAPARVGDLITLYASVNYVHNTSMEVGVRVESENPIKNIKKHIATAYLTFVALDENGRPTQVPKLKPETKEEKRRYQQAKLRREARLKLKKDLEKKWKD